ncbi:MAG: hypothetical protein IIU30_09655, partial [Treponema sp.]|nr:hypothetical protein [Treponema sp.]
VYEKSYFKTSKAFFVTGSFFLLYYCGAFICATKVPPKKVFPFFQNKQRQGRRVKSLHNSPRVFARKPVIKNGKEAIFYGLSGVPASASIAPLRSATLQGVPPLAPLQSRPCLQLLTEFSQKTPGQAPPATIPAVP